jgi:predicted ABC-type ATPase
MNYYLVIAGVSGSGKSVLEKKLVEIYPDEYNKIVQTTTRARRVNEAKDAYVWLTPDQYDKFKHLLIGRTYFDGSNYGSIPVPCNGKINTIILNYEGLMDFVNNLNQKENRFVVVGIDKDNQAIEKRETRDIELLNSERKVLDYCDRIFYLDDNEWIDPAQINTYTNMAFYSYHDIVKERIKKGVFSQGVI